MERRDFLKIGAQGSAVIIVAPPSFYNLYKGALLDSDLSKGFLTPPPTSKPYTWWHWMNGNITREGITLDLEFLKRAGLGGFQLFQVGTGIPKGPVNFGGDEWLALLQHAASEASRLGLEYDMMNGGGWSSSGGPWITPELGMQQMTWTETNIKGGGQVNIILSKPYTKLNYYRDAFVLAFPTPAGEGEPFNIDNVLRVTSDKGAIDKKIFSAGLWNSRAGVSSGDKSGVSHLQVEFDALYTASSVMLYGRRVETPQQRLLGGSHMVTLESSIDGSGFSKVCDFPFESIRKESLEVPSVANFSPVKARFFRFIFSDNTEIFSLRILPNACIEDWPTKANFTRRGTVSAGNMLYSNGTAPSGSVIPLQSVIDITKNMDSEGRLSWDAPKGDWTILRLGQTAVGVQNHPAPDGGLGLEVDKYSKEAYHFHFSHFFDRLLPFLKTMGKNNMSGSVIDSYEVGMQTWTKMFPQEFKNRRGYDFTNYLPALVGYIVENVKTSERFLWDIRRTEADMMDDNYYGYYADLCRQHNMKAYCEPYSGGPFDEFQAGAKMDIPMSEFWCGMGASNGVFYSVKLVSSIAHIYGKKINGAESYTGIPFQTKWQMYPYALKGQGDWMYTLGLNKFIFHVYAMQPHPTAKPGMTMGPWGWMHSRNNSWAEYEDDWISYVHRTQYLLQKGLTVADIVYFAGEQIPTDTPVLPAQLLPKPPKGYDYDVTDAVGILTRMKADKGQIVLPDGKRYRLLIIPESKVISFSVLQKLDELVKEGVWLLGPRPNYGPGLGGGTEEDDKIMQLSRSMWGDLDGSQKTERNYGKGRIFWGKPIHDILEELNLGPDFEFSSKSGDAPINYIHLLIDNSDVYFISNRRRQEEDIVCTFRVKGKEPELWKSDTGSILSYPFYESFENETRVPLHLDPAGSVFVVFRSKTDGGISSVERKGIELLSTKPFPTTDPRIRMGISNNFSVSVWIKPDIEIGLQQQFGWLSDPVSFVFYPSSGNDLFGAGHACCGMSAGRNGVLVYERSGKNIEVVLAVEKPISGWAHLCLIYNSGKPELYINGQISGEGQVSKDIVHPGTEGASQDEYISYFHGELGNLKLFDKVIDKESIQDIYSKGLPSAVTPGSFESVESNVKGSKAILFWENGSFELLDKRKKISIVEVEGIPGPTQLNGEWKVSFPTGLGAPSSIDLQELISLKDHPDDRVKYFSGTAIYQKEIQIPADLIDNNRRLYLDLGWVEVMAQVELNDNAVGTVWKPPYRLDISNVVNPGKNKLVVKVTNQWTNRLIGDEHLPPENEYGNGGTGPAAEFRNEIKKLPEWYVEGKPKPPGGRITFATWKHYDKNDPLLESGLIGPVYLRSAVKKQIDI